MSIRPNISLYAKIKSNLDFCNILISHAQVFTTPHVFYSGRRPEYRTDLILTVVLPVQWPLCCIVTVCQGRPGPARLNVNNSTWLTADNWHCSSINVGCLNCNRLETKLPLSTTSLTTTGWTFLYCLKLGLHRTLQILSWATSRLQVTLRFTCHDRRVPTGKARRAVAVCR